jgi:molybdenum cofactor cytidylyltransferase
MMSIDGIILAAGFSKRAGVFKPLVQLGNRTIIQRAIDSIRPVCQKIIVVTGFMHEEIENHLAQDSSALEFVYNAEYEKGMFSSVRCALPHVQSEHFLILPGDQPALKSATAVLMAKADGDIIQSRYQGKKGHPIRIHRKFIPEILQMPETAVLRDFMHAHLPQILDVDDAGILMDADTPEDIDKIYKYIIKEDL